MPGDEVAEVLDGIGQPPARVHGDRAGEDDEDRRVALDLVVDVGTQHLDGDLGAVAEMAGVDLRHRRRRDRLLVELGEVVLEAGRPARASTVSRTWAKSNAGIRSWSCRSSSMISGSRRSGRVDSTWPSLTKLAPSAVSARRRTAPCQCATDRRRASRSRMKTRRAASRRVDDEEPPDDRAHHDEARDVAERLHGLQHQALLVGEQLLLHAEQRLVGLEQLLGARADLRRPAARARAPRCRASPGTSPARPPRR